MQVVEALDLPPGRQLLVEPVLDDVKRLPGIIGAAVGAMAPYDIGQLVQVDAAPDGEDRQHLHVEGSDPDALTVGRPEHVHLIVAPAKTERHGVGDAKRLGQVRAGDRPTGRSP
jgi:hypothetical protein